MTDYQLAEMLQMVENEERFNHSRKRPTSVTKALNRAKKRSVLIEEQINNSEKKPPAVSKAFNGILLPESNPNRVPLHESKRVTLKDHKIDPWGLYLDFKKVVKNGFK